MSSVPSAAASDSAGTVKKLFSGTATLTASAVLVKIVGLIYKIPLIKYVGVDGMAYFLAANHIYILLFVVSTAGLPVAVSLMISQSRARASEDSASVFGAAMKVCLAVGLVGSASVALGAPLISNAIGISGASGCMVAISPAVLFSCISGGYRGYYQGHQAMMPTAISQLLESFGKLALGVGGAIYACRRGFSSQTVAAYAIFGTSAGIALGTLYLILIKPAFDKKQNGEVQSKHNSDGRFTAKLIRLALPITLSAAVTSLGGVIDTALISNRLRFCGLSEQMANRLYSCYGNLAVPLFNLVPSLLSPLAAALVPLISSSRSLSDGKGGKFAAGLSFELALLVSLPASAGIALFSEPILALVFSSDMSAVKLAAPMLTLLGLSVPLVCLVGTSCAVLQSYGMAGKTVISMLIGTALKTVSEYILLGIPSVNICGAPISTALSNIVILAINLYFVERADGGVGRLRLPLIKTASAALVSVGGVYLVWIRFVPLGKSLLIVPAVCAAGAVYLILNYFIGGAGSGLVRLPMSYIKRKELKNEQTGDNSRSARTRAL